MPKDQAYDQKLHESPQKSIRSGFLWIGTASAISQTLTALAMLVVMLFLTKEEIGAATISLSIAGILEAFNSLGTNRALLQDKNLTENETHSVFWFSVMFGGAFFLILSPLAWPVAWFFDLQALVPLFIVSILKVTLVTTASIPLQLINRRLEYQKLSAINTLTTLSCSIIKITLAVCGFGPWALVIGDTAYGLGQIIGAFAFSKYRPKLHFKIQECTRFIKYGIKFCISNALEQGNKNLHYLIVAKILGEGAVGIYRIAYEIAMTPAMALFDVVAKSSFPVFARLQDDRKELSRLFLWNQRNISLFAAIPSVFLLFASPDIFNIMSNSDWLDSSRIIPFVLLVAFIKVLLQAYQDIYRACGRPEYPIITTGVEAISVSLLCSGTIYLTPEPYKLQAMMITWSLVLLGIFVIHRQFVHKFIDASIPELTSNIKHGVAFCAITSLFSIPLLLLRPYLPFPYWTHLIAEFIVELACLFGYARVVLKISLTDMLKRKRKADK